MVSERLQLLIETLGGARAVDELQKIGNAGKTEFDKAATAGTRAANDISAAQARVASATEAGNARIAASNQRLEVAQLRAAQASAAVERAQVKVGESAAGTVVAARAAEALEAAQLKAAHATAAVEVAQAKHAATTTTANKAIAASRVELAAAEAATAKLGTSTGIADTALSKLGLSGVATGSALKTGVAAGAAAAGVAIGAMALKGIRDFADLAEEIDTVQDVLGGSAEEASKLRYAATVLGVEINTVASAGFRLSQAIAKNNGDLSAFGIQVERNAQGNVDLYGTLTNIADAYTQIQDPVAANRLLFDIFGRSGIQLVDILRAGGSQLREFAKDAERAGQVMDEASVQKGKDFNIAMEKAGLSVKGLTIALGGGLVGALTQAVGGMSQLTDKASSLLRPVGGLGGVVEEAVRAMVPAVSVLGLFGDKAKSAGDAASEAAPGLDKAATGARGMGEATEDATPSVGLMAGAAEALKEHLDPLPRELKNTGSSAGGMANELERARDAAGQLTDKLDELLGGTASVEQATSDYEAALDELSSTFTENGTSLDLSTEKGRENAGAVRDLVGTVRDHIQSLIDNGATQDQVRTQFNAHIEDFRRVMRQMGLNQQEIDALITKYGLVPESVETAVQLTGVEQAIADTDRVVNHLVERFGIAQDAARISVQVFGLDQAESRLAAINRDFGNIDLSSAPAHPDQDGDGAASYVSEAEAASAAGNILGARGVVPLAAGGRTRGGITRGPSYLVGEGHPSWEEYVLATDPVHRVRNTKLWTKAGQRMGLLGGSATPRIIGAGGGSSAPSGSVGVGTGTDLSGVLSRIEGLLAGLEREGIRAAVTQADVSTGMYRRRRALS